MGIDTALPGTLQHIFWLTTPIFQQDLGHLYPIDSKL